MRSRKRGRAHSGTQQSDFSREFDRTNQFNDCCAWSASARLSLAHGSIDAALQNADAILDADATANHEVAYHGGRAACSMLHRSRKTDDALGLATCFLTRWRTSGTSARQAAGWLMTCERRVGLGGTDATNSAVMGSARSAAP